MRIGFILLIGLLFISACTVSEIKTGEINEPLAESIDRNTESVPSSAESSRITQDELSRHSLETNCWISYETKVYDVTDFLPKHPGSAQAIIPYCGTSTEFETAFVEKHGSEMANKLTLVGIYKGDLE